MAYKFETLKILIIETSNTMFDLTRSVLTSFGVTNISSAYTIEEGYEVFSSFKPDIVILDWMANPEDGIKLTKMIRGNEDSFNKYVPIIMMTGFSQKRCVIKARDAGVTEFVVKPFTAVSLYDKLEKIIEQPRQFVKSRAFTGPDRRRRTNDFTGDDKRKPAPKK